MTPIDKAIYRMTASQRAVMKMNVKEAPKMKTPEAKSATQSAKAERSIES